jgi:hypothetical protein
MDPKKVRELEKVSVKNFVQLEAAVKPFLATESAIYKLLIDGMNMVKRQAAFADKAAEVNMEDFGGYAPAMPAPGSHYGWVDTLISRRLDGKRQGLVITWDLPEGNFTFDPFTQKLEKSNG